VDGASILETAETRIRRHRTGKARLRFVTRGGIALAHFEGRVRLASHEFRLGANAYRLRAIKDKALQQAYETRFDALLNYATLPFYWGGYEKWPGKTEVKRLEAMARWCKRRKITTKGHPLVWHEVFPEWAKEISDGEVLARLRERVEAIVSHFAGLIDIWDVVNEATVAQQFDNAVGRWMSGGAETRVNEALLWAHSAAPGAALLYNDFNISPDFEGVVAGLQKSGAPLAAVGIQSHMHKEHWPLEKAWQVCETYGQFGLSLHFTEVTVLSGRFKAPDDNDWQRVRTDWPTTAEDEAAQLEYGRKFYTLLFSHPAVEAVTWWDLSDDGAWQGAPAGLVRKDMTPKPLYEWLMSAFGQGGVWSTDERIVTDSTGCADVSCFFGTYKVTGKAASGERLRGNFTLRRGGPREVEIEME